MADDEKFGLTGEENKGKRVSYRKMSRSVEKKRTSTYKRKLAREFEKEKEFYTSKETNPSFIKRTIAKITYSSPVQAIVKAVRYLREKLNSIKVSYVHMPEEKKTIFHKLIIVITSAIEKFTDWIAKKTKGAKEKLFPSDGVKNRQEEPIYSLGGASA